MNDPTKGKETPKFISAVPDKFQLLPGNLIPPGLILSSYLGGYHAI